MDAKQRYIRESGYDVAEDFVESLQELDVRTGIKVAKFIEKKATHLEHNPLISTVVGGVVIDDNNQPVTFALEMIKTHSPHVILSDIKLVSMDEYLDLLNLNIKSNEKRKNKRLKKDSRTGL